MSTRSVFRFLRLVSRSFQKLSAFCAPVFVLITIRSRVWANASPSFSSLSVYHLAVSK